MLARSLLCVCAVTALSLFASSPAWADEPSHDAFTYQGELRHGGNPVSGPVNLKFRLFSAAGGGQQVGPELSVNGFEDFDDAGRFTIDLAFGKEIFDGTPLWLEIQVGATTLAPRQPLMPVPYAVRALTIAPTAAPFLYSGPDAIFTGGNVGIGTSTPLAPLHVSSGDGLAVMMPGLRLFQNTESPNVVGGFDGNQVTTGIVGATIAGGGWLVNGWVNRVTREFGTVGGGANNTSGGEFSNIGGGFGNTVTGTSSTIGGGANNTIGGDYAVVPGGFLNAAAGHHSFAAGYSAKANHQGAFVWADWTAGDFASTASNQFLIRASGNVGINTTTPGSTLQVNGGIRARGGPPGALGVNNNGYAFSGNGGDNDAGMFSSTDGQIEFHTNGQEWMRINAAGRVGINTTSPGSFVLAVNGDAAKPGGGSWSVFSDARLKRSITPIGAEGGMLERLLALHGYTFEYCDEAIERRLGLPGVQTGLLAQEVAEVFPDWVKADDDGYLFVTERGLTAILVESLRELRAEKESQIEALQSRIEALERKMERLLETGAAPPRSGAR